MAQGDVVVDLTNSLPKRCAVFDGVDDKVVLASSADINFKTENSFSFGCWAKKLGVGASGYNIGFIGNNFNTAIGVKDNSNLIVWGLRSATNTTHVRTDSIAGLDSKAWNHYFITYNSATKETILYINGVNKVSFTSTITDLDLSTSNWDIRYSIIGGNRTFVKCGIADCQIFKRTLSEAEVSDIVSGKNTSEGLLHRYKLDKDYKDSVGSVDGTNTGSYLSTVDDQVSTNIKNARTTANDKYLISVINNKVLTSVIEEV